MDKMYKLAELFKKDLNVDINQKDRFGTNFAQFALYEYGIANSKGDQHEMDFCKSVFNKVVDNENFDINDVDMNEDTALNIAVEYECTLWAVEKILSKPNADVNRRNFFKSSPFTTAVISGNTKALELLIKRSDLVISENDINEAKQHGYEIDVMTKTVKQVA